MNPRSCKGVFVLLSAPLVIIALIVALVSNAGAFTVAQLVLFPAFGAFFLCGWLFVLSAYVPERVGIWVTRVNLVMMQITTLWFAVGAVWFGVEVLVTGSNEPHVGWIMIGVGAFMVGVSLLIVFRKKLPWNRGNSLPTGRNYRHHRLSSAVRLTDHLGETKEFRLDTTVSANDVRNSRGKLIPSRLAWVIENAGLDVEVVPAGISISSWELLATEVTGSGQITFKLPRAATQVDALWQSAAS